MPPSLPITSEATSSADEETAAVTGTGTVGTDAFAGLVDHVRGPQRLHQVAGREIVGGESLAASSVTSTVRSGAPMV